MSTLTTTQRAPILADGDPVPDGTFIELTGGVSVTPVGGFSYLVGNTAGPYTLLVAKDGRSGSLEGEVVAAPLVVTLGDPEPK